MKLVALPIGSASGQFLISSFWKRKDWHNFVSYIKRGRKIELFEKKWMNLKEQFGITVPNKCHIIFTHVKEFIFAKKMALGSLSEQVVEACHSKWIKLWESSYKIRK